jgi:two-component system response regulator VanR
MGLRVLVVDDDESVCTLLRTLLERANFECEVVSNGDEAVRRLRATTYDAVLLDLMLPGTWGFDIIRFLQAERPSMTRRVIVITAASNATLRDFDASSIYALLRKPFDITMLVDAVRECTAAAAPGRTLHSRPQA